MNLLTRYLEPIYFKKFLVIFWTFWWLVAFLTDLFGGLKQLAIMKGDWIYTGNYPDLVKSIAMYHGSTGHAAVLFIAIILGSLICTLFFIWASIALLQDENKWMKVAVIAYIVSLTFWFLFFFADEITMRFDLVENHMVQAAIEFFSLLVLFLLPNKLEEIG